MLSDAHNPASDPVGVPTYVTMQQLADVVRCSKRAVQYWEESGVIPPAMRIGRFVRFDLHASLAALRERAIATQRAKEEAALRAREPA
ncbi:hypothetical protein VVD49_11845 [Uliginosibacterium sp. H3]|uniref:Helix-turn-helix domain-containing protein n=1 Tax=Uliginosibacterium silvisoli TaxID=3114758 RepID=A0ABU6K471_9RHOO|nr:hypothetical protein [Uliginosibacterium sp. H3]